MRPRLYVASPVFAYGTARYRAMVSHARQHFPRFSMVEPRLEFISTSDWLRRWPDVLETLDAIVAFGCIDNTIGKGVYAEVFDALAIGVPVWWLSEDGGLVDHSDVRIRRYPSLSRTLPHFARVYMPMIPKGERTNQVGLDALPAGSFGAMLGK